jgi:hypothetical protein
MMRRFDTECTAPNCRRYWYNQACDTQGHTSRSGVSADRRLLLTKRVKKRSDPYEGYGPFLDICVHCKGWEKEHPAGRCLLTWQRFEGGGILAY